MYQGMFLASVQLKFVRGEVNVSPGIWLQSTDCAFQALTYCSHLKSHDIHTISLVCSSSIISPRLLKKHLGDG